MLSLRIAFGKILLTLLGLACGASIGREGPTVQIGATLMNAFGRYHAPAAPRAAARARARRRRGGHRGGVQHAARRDRVRDRGAEPFLPGAHLRHRARRGDHRRHRDGRDRRQLHLFRHQLGRARLRHAVGRGAGLRRVRRPRGRAVQHHPGARRVRPAGAGGTLGDRAIRWRSRRSAGSRSPPSARSRTARPTAPAMPRRARSSRAARTCRPRSSC